MARPPRILVLHDDPVVGRVLTRALREAGYEVTARESHPAGASGGEPRWDLVISNSHGGAELRRCFAGSRVLHLDELANPRLSRRPRDTSTGYYSFSLGRLLAAVAGLLDGRAAD